MIPAEQEVHRAQPQDGEDVRGVDEEGVGGDGEDRGDGVHGEDQVGGLHQDQDHEERGGRAAGAPTDELAREEPLPVVGGAHRHEAAHQLEHRVGLGLDVQLVLRGHADSREDQEGAEDVDDPVEALDEDGAGADHRAAHEERAEDPPEEHPVLVLGRDPEVGEDRG